MLRVGLNRISREPIARPIARLLSSIDQLWDATAVDTTAAAGAAEATSAAAAESAAPAVSSAGLVQFLEAHRWEWDPRLNKRRNKRNGGERGGRRGANPFPFRTANGRQPAPTPISLLPPPRTEELTGRFQARIIDSHSKELTNRVVAAFAHTDKQLSSSHLSLEEKAQVARRCLLTFRRMSQLPLSDINIAAIMHRVSRLASHAGLGRGFSALAAAARGGPPLPELPGGDFFAAELLMELFNEVLRRAKEQLKSPERGAASPVENLEESGSGVDVGEVERAAVAFGRKAEASSWGVALHESAIAGALHACSMMCINVSQEDADTLAAVALQSRSQWSSVRIVMLALALGRMGLKPLGGKLHEAMLEEAAAKLPDMTGDDICSLLWGMAHSDFHPGQKFVTSTMAVLLPKVQGLQGKGITAYNGLGALALLEWNPPPPKRQREAWYSKWDHASLQKLQKEREEEEAAAAAEEAAAASSGRPRDLRQLQAMARAWEVGRRQGLAALLEGQQPRSSSSGVLEEKESIFDRKKAVGGGGVDASLAELARRAVKVQAARDKAAQLTYEVSQLMRQLLAQHQVSLPAGASSSGGGRGGGGGGVPSSSGVDGKGSVSGERSGGSSVNGWQKAGNGAEEDEAALAHRFFTGEWPDEEQQLLEFSSFAHRQLVQAAEDALISTSREPLSHTRKDKRGARAAAPSAGAGNGRKVLRMGPLLAEAMREGGPDNRLVIQPHYEKHHVIAPWIRRTIGLKDPAAEAGPGGGDFSVCTVASAADEKEEEERAALGLDLNLDVHSMGSTAAAPLMDAAEDPELLERRFLSSGGGDGEGMAWDFPSLEDKSEASDIGSSIADAISGEEEREESSNSSADFLLSPQVEENFSEVADAAAAALEELVRCAVAMVQSNIRLDQAVALGRYVCMVKHYDRPLLQAMCARMAAAVEAAEMGGNEAAHPGLMLPSLYVADFFWVLASFGAEDLLPKELGENLLKRAVANPAATPTSLARTLWSLAVMDRLEPEMLAQVCSSPALAALSRGDAATAPDETFRKKLTAKVVEITLNQLFQAALAVEGTRGVSRTSTMPPELREAAEAAWSGRHRHLTTSSLQRQVAVGLRALGLECQMEYSPPGTHVIIDVMVTDPKTRRQVAVEVDGPSHFAFNELDRPLGAMRLRDALLKQRGWTVVSVPYFEWDQMRTPEARAGYLKAKVMPLLRR